MNIRYLGTLEAGSMCVTKKEDLKRGLRFIFKIQQNTLQSYPAFYLFLEDNTIVLPALASYISLILPIRPFVFLGVNTFVYVLSLSLWQLVPLSL